MAIITFPLNNTDYTADAMALYCSNRTNGVFSADGELSVLSNNNMTVTVKPGRAWIKFDKFKGYVFGSDADVVLTIGIADGVLNRIDRVCVKYDVIANTSSLYVKRGTPNSNPTPPPLTRDTTTAYELALADIYIAKGVTSIVSANITDKRLDSSVCGLVSDGISSIATDVLNNQFQDWFTNLRNQLDSNQATNLQNQITNLSSTKIDKTSIADNLTTNDNTKVLSAKQGVNIASQLAERTNEIQRGETGWYKDKKTGYIHQWGVVIGRLNPVNYPSDLLSITFPIAFPTVGFPEACVCVENVTLNSRHWLSAVNCGFRVATTTAGEIEIGMVRTLDKEYNFKIHWSVIGY